MPLPVARFQTQVNRKAQPHQPVQFPAYSRPLNTLDRLCSFPQSTAPIAPCTFPLCSFRILHYHFCINRRRPPQRPQMSTSWPKVLAWRIAQGTADVAANNKPRPIRSQCLTDRTLCASTASADPEAALRSHRHQASGQLPGEACCMREEMGDPPAATPARWHRKPTPRVGCYSPTAHPPAVRRPTGPHGNHDSSTLPLPREPIAKPRIP